MGCHTIRHVLYGVCMAGIAVVTDVRSCVHTAATKAPSAGGALTPCVGQHGMSGAHPDRRIVYLWPL